MIEILDAARDIQPNLAPEDALEEVQGMNTAQYIAISNYKIKI